MDEDNFCDDGDTTSTKVEAAALLIEALNKTSDRRIKALGVDILTSLHKSMHVHKVRVEVIEGGKKDGTGD